MSKEIIKKISEYVKGFVALIFTSIYTVYFQQNFKLFIFTCFNGKFGQLAYGLGNSIIMFLIGILPFFTWSFFKFIWEKFIKKTEIRIGYDVTSSKTSKNYTIEKNKEKYKIIFCSSELFEEGFDLKITLSSSNIQKCKMTLLGYLNVILTFKCIPPMSFNLGETKYDNEFDKLYEIKSLKNQLDINCFNAWKQAKKEKNLSIPVHCAMGLPENSYEMKFTAKSKYKYCPDWIVNLLMNVRGTIEIEGEIDEK
ncbi:hypothetical protein [Weissella minor]|uniref:hypothetical protein n=1 Tax=Weissella minor TaxID=1620 RepID=UPI003AF2DA90